jgi:hypothetical protein
MTDYIGLLADHFGVERSVIQHCTQMTKKELKDVSAADIYECVMEKIGVSEHLPREISSSIFGILDTEDFVKICKLNMRHAQLCEQPQYWLAYLKDKPREDWMYVIRSYAVAEDDENVLDVLLKAYIKRYNRSVLDVLLDYTDTYTLDELYEFVNGIGTDVDDVYDTEIMTLLAILKPPKKGMSDLMKDIMKENYQYLYFISWLGRSLKAGKDDKKIFEAEQNFDYVMFEEDDIPVEEQFDMRVLSIAHYFPTIESINPDYLAIKYFDEDPLIDFINEGYDTINSSLARDILSKYPNILSQVDKDAKQHIKKLLKI